MGKSRPNCFANFDTASLASPILTARTTNPPSLCLAYTALISGISMRHGAHQVAQKFNSTTLPRKSERLCRSPSKVASSKSGARWLAFVPTGMLDSPSGGLGDAGSGEAGACSTGAVGISAARTGMALGSAFRPAFAHTTPTKATSTMNNVTNMVPSVFCRARSFCFRLSLFFATK